VATQWRECGRRGGRTQGELNANGQQTGHGSRRTPITPTPGVLRTGCSQRGRCVESLRFPLFDRLSMRSSLAWALSSTTW